MVVSFAAVIGTGVANLHPDQWWGEGEIKVYMDGDKDFPTIAARAARTTWACRGASSSAVPLQRMQPEQEELRVDVPLALGGPDRLAEGVPDHDPADRLKGLAETQDDWSCATFWYEPVPSEPLPPMPDFKARTADLWNDAFAEEMTASASHSASFPLLLGMSLSVVVMAWLEDAVRISSHVWIHSWAVFRSWAW